MNSEQELITGCRNGILKYQEALYKQFYSFAMSVCLRYTRNREDAQEVLNDSFMKFFKNIQKYDDSKPFKPWFHRILVNTCLDHHRTKQRYNRLQLVEDDQFETVVASDYEMKMNAQEILKLFDHLSDIQRVIFNLYEIEGYNHNEIAEMLDISAGTSRSHLSRAKKRLGTLYIHSRMEDHHEII